MTINKKVFDMKKVLLLAFSVCFLGLGGCASKVVNEPKPCACGEMKELNSHYRQSIS